MGKIIKLNPDLVDLIFRLLFCLIFIALGGEHLLKDDLIQKLMPHWLPFPRIVSLGCGFVLLLGGGLIAVGYRLQFAALLLGTFLVIVTAIVHGPALTRTPDFVAPDSEWLWQVLQRSNYVKNLCLLGVCLLLLNYKAGRWSLESWLEQKRASEASARMDRPQ